VRVTRLGYNAVVITTATRGESIMTVAPTLSAPIVGRDAVPTSASVPAVTVVVATRHQVDRVDELEERIRRAMATTGATFEILFVDDSEAESGPIAGRGGVMVCLDSDLRHPPELLAPMTRLLLDDRADIVVATRYLPGGGVDRLASVWRRALSATGRDVTRLVLSRLRSATDPRSGCFGFDRAVLDGIGLRPRRGRTLVDVLARGRWDRLAEVPYRPAKGSHEGSRGTWAEGLGAISQLVGLASDRSLTRRAPTSARTLHAIALDPGTGHDGPTALVACPPLPQAERAARTDRRTA
jgi:hypothetical protein